MNLLELAEAKERGERIMVCNDVDEWQEWDGKQWRDQWEFRIAPKKEMTLVEELRSQQPKATGGLFHRAADRIEFLEQAQNAPLHLFTTDELLAEIKRRTE